MNVVIMASICGYLQEIQLVQQVVVLVRRRLERVIARTKEQQFLFRVMVLRSTMKVRIYAPQQQPRQHRQQQPQQDQLQQPRQDQPQQPRQDQHRVDVATF